MIDPWKGNALTQHDEARVRRINRCIDALTERYGSTRLDKMAADEGMRGEHAASIHRNDMSFVSLQRPVVAAFGPTREGQIKGIQQVLVAHAENLATAQVTVPATKQAGNNTESQEDTEQQLAVA
jgi:hypothetical protein